MYRLAALAILCALAPVALADACKDARPGSYGNVTVSTLVGVYDGDSFTVSIEGWPRVIGDAIGVRVAGVDTPELRGKCPAEKVLARKARAFTRSALLSAKTIELRNLRRDKYFRILADVCIDGEPLADQLISSGVGYRYEGGKKQGWCER